MARPAKKSTKKASASAKIEKAAEPTVAELQAPAVDGSTLTLSDLQTIAQVIDAATRRGAFGAAEVSEVGAIYTKLTTFLNVVASQQREAGAPEGEGEDSK
jgi:hypothetical protein